LKEVDLYGGGPSKAQLLALNPKGKVPVLQHGAIVVTESERILDYIADHWGSGEVGEGGQGQGGRKLRADDADAERWWRATLNDELLPVGKASVLGGGRGMTADLRGVLQKCEGRLVGATPGGPSYLAGGSSVSLADVSGFPFLWRLDDEYSLSGSGYPRLAAWLDRVQGIDAFRSTVEDSWWWWW
jgi:glutathione S-transferase